MTSLSTSLYGYKLNSGNSGAVQTALSSKEAKIFSQLQMLCQKIVRNEMGIDSEQDLEMKSACDHIIEKISKQFPQLDKKFISMALCAPELLDQELSKFDTLNPHGSFDKLMKKMESQIFDEGFKRTKQEIKAAQAEINDISEKLPKLFNLSEEEFGELGQRFYLKFIYLLNSVEQNGSSQINLGKFFSTSSNLSQLNSFSNFLKLFSKFFAENQKLEIEDLQEKEKNWAFDTVTSVDSKQFEKECLEIFHTDAGLKGKNSRALNIPDYNIEDERIVFQNEKEQKQVGKQELCMQRLNDIDQYVQILKGKYALEESACKELSQILQLMHTQAPHNLAAHPVRMYFASAFAQIASDLLHVNVDSKPTLPFTVKFDSSKEMPVISFSFSQKSVTVSYKVSEDGITTYLPVGTCDYNYTISCSLRKEPALENGSKTIEKQVLDFDEEDNPIQVIRQVRIAPKSFVYWELSDCSVELNNLKTSKEYLNSDNIKKED